MIMVTNIFASMENILGCEFKIWTKTVNFYKWQKLVQYVFEGVLFFLNMRLVSMTWIESSSHFIYTYAKPNNKYHHIEEWLESLQMEWHEYDKNQIRTGFLYFFISTNVTYHTVLAFQQCTDNLFAKIWQIIHPEFFSQFLQDI